MITTLYASILAVMFILLSGRVILGRYKYRVSLGDGGNDDLGRRIRIHGNFAEYIPFALLLMFMLDYEHEGPILLHVLGILLVLGRILHLWGVSTPQGPTYARAGGMILTFTVILICAALLIWNFGVLRLTAI